jgi:hypothetical protein
MTAVKILRLVGGFVVPTALFYVLRALGVSLYLTLVVAAVLPATFAVVAFVRSRRTDGLAVYMLTIMLLAPASR